MPQGDKGAYTDKQKRQAEHIEEGYEKKGVSKKTAKARAWATVNKETGGGKKSGSGRGKAVKRTAAKKGGRKAAKSQSTAKRSAAGKKAAATRKRRASR
jgi:hypothetical protein